MRGSNAEHKGKQDCKDVLFSSWNNSHQNCIFCVEDMPCLLMTNLSLAEQKLQEWIDKHPKITNRDKFREVFGTKVELDVIRVSTGCFRICCPSEITDCKNCEYNNFWNKEYIPQKSDKKEEEDKNE